MIPMRTLIIIVVVLGISIALACVRSLTKQSSPDPDPGATTGAAVDPVIMQASNAPPALTAYNAPEAFQQHAQRHQKHTTRMTDDGPPF